MICTTHFMQYSLWCSDSVAALLVFPFLVTYCRLSSRHFTSINPWKLPITFQVKARYLLALMAEALQRCHCRRTSVVMFMCLPQTLHAKRDEVSQSPNVHHVVTAVIATFFMFYRPLAPAPVLRFFSTLHLPDIVFVLRGLVQRL